MQKSYLNLVSLCYAVFSLAAVLGLSIILFQTPAYAVSKWQLNYNKAVGFLKIKKYNSALKFAKISLKENKNPYTLQLNGNILQFLKKYKKSNYYFKKSLALIITRVNKKGSTSKKTDNFIKIIKNNIGVNYLLAGNRQLKKKNIKDAINNYKKGLAFANKKHLTDDLMINAAISYENINKFKPAIYYSKKVVANSPKNAFGYFVKGRAEYGLNELNLSIADLKTAVKLSPSDKLFKSALKLVEKKKNAKKY